jgi:hypothetical protein
MMKYNSNINILRKNFINDLYQKNEELRLDYIIDNQETVKTFLPYGSFLQDILEAIPKEKFFQFYDWLKKANIHHEKVTIYLQCFYNIELQYENFKENLLLTPIERRMPYIERYISEAIVQSIFARSDFFKEIRANLSEQDQRQFDILRRGIFSKTLTMPSQQETSLNRFPLVSTIGGLQQDQSNPNIEKPKQESPQCFKI